MVASPCQSILTFHHLDIAKDPETAHLMFGLGQAAVLTESKFEDQPATQQTSNKRSLPLIHFSPLTISPPASSLTLIRPSTAIYNLISYIHFTTYITPSHPYSCPPRSLNQPQSISRSA